MLNFVLKILGPLLLSSEAIALGIPILTVVCPYLVLILSLSCPYLVSISSVSFPYFICPYLFSILSLSCPYLALILVKYCNLNPGVRMLKKGCWEIFDNHLTLWETRLFSGAYHQYRGHRRCHIHT